jgi:stress 70 chaperone-associated protein
VAFVIGYFAQKSGLAPPPPVLGIDLGTTFSSIATFQTNTGQSNVLVDGNGRKSIPSVVAFL